MKNLTHPSESKTKIGPKRDQKSEDYMSHYVELKKVIFHLESRMEKSDERLIQVAKASKDRFSRIQSSLASLEFLFKKHAEETKNTFSEMNSLKVKNTVFKETVKKHMSEQQDFNQKVETYFSNIKKQMHQL